MLAYAISGEAGPGKDKAAVAASILNRVSSKNFPNTVKDVVLDKDQYEAITKGLAFHDEDLVNFLKSDEGQKQIIEALGILQGRTDFKGQSQIVIGLLRRILCSLRRVTSSIIHGKLLVIL